MINNIYISRRSAIFSLAGSTALLGMPAFALSKAEAEELINHLSNDVLSAINAQSSRDELFEKFEKIFANYADVFLIARKALGPTWRSANKTQRSAYVSAFRGYMARYYGKQFEEFIGAKIIIDKSRKTSGGYLVDSKIIFKDGSNYLAQWHVVDAHGKFLMYNLFLEGVSVLSDVRIQIGSMLDKRGGSIDELTNYLLTTG